MSIPEQLADYIGVLIGTHGRETHWDMGGTLVGRGLCAFVMAAVRVVFPWSTCPTVPMFK